MLSTVARPLRRTGVVACAGLVAAALTSGCVRTIDDAGQPVTRMGSTPVTSAALADLLIDPDRFPASHPAAVLDRAGAEAVIGDVDGVVAGAAVDPPRCAPPPLGDAVAVRGVNDETPGSLIVALVRVDAELAQRRAQLAGCPTFDVTVDGRTSTVRALLLPAPPVDADGAYALELAVTEPTGPARQVLTLVAQVADVRVTAAWVGGEDAPPDTEALDALFRDAVLRVHRGGPR